MQEPAASSVQLSVIDPSESSTQPWLWVPTLIAAHAFAAFWLVRMYLLAHPGLWRVVCVQAAYLGRITCSNENAAVSGSALACAAQVVTQCNTPESQVQPVAQPSLHAECNQHHTQRQEGPRLLQSVIRRHSSLVQPLSLHWQDIGCTYETPSGPRAVLQGVSGRADSSTLHALMGPSGAGKSSLMDILAQRKQVGQLTGSVLLGGQTTTAKAMAQHSAYVPQEDNFMPVMSAKETLRFYAAMVLPPRLSKAARKARVEEVLAVVGLSHCTHTLVGGHLPGGLTLRGLSGGERKRLAIAVGLLAAPSLLFLDEPTSGLDSYAALTVLRYIRAMADEAGHVVVASIHQPRSAIWSMFDTVTVLSKGLMMYTGPREGMVPWFTLQLPTAYNNLQQQQQSDRAASPYVTVEVVSTPAGSDLDGSSVLDTEVVVLPQFSYNPELHGVASDWVMDLVSVGFGGSTLPAKCDQVGAACNSFRNIEELQAAAAAFAQFHSSSHLQAAINVPSPQLQVPGFNQHQAVVGPTEPSSWHAGANTRGPPASMRTRRAPDALATVSLGAVTSYSGAAKLGQDIPCVPRHNTLPPHRAPVGQTVVSLPALYAGVTGDEAEQQLCQRMEQLYCKSTAVPQHACTANLSSTEGSATSSHHEGNSRPTSTGGSSSAVTLNSAAVRGATDGKAAAQLMKDFEAASMQANRAHDAPGRGVQLMRSSQSGGDAPPHTRLPSTVSMWLVCLSWMCCCCVGMPTGMLRWFTHLRALLWREVTCITRNPADVAGRLLTFAWIAVFSGLVFYSIPNSADSMQLRLNVHFANTAFFLLMPYISMSLYTADRQFYLADVSSRLYKPLTYYIAKVSATLPFNLLCAVVYCLIINGMTGLRHSSIVQTSAITSMVSLIAVQVLHTAAILAPNQDLAFMLAIAWTALNLLLSGFFIRYQQFAFNWLSQLRWLSAQGYAFEGLAGVELRGTAFNCSAGMDDHTLQLLPSLLPDTMLAQSPLAQQVLAHPGPGCVARADAVLDYFELHRGFGATFAILLGYWGIMHCLTYAALVVASRAERR